MPLTIQSKRRGTSIYFGVTLSDSQIVVNWTDLDIKDVFMYSEAQRSYAGRCTYEIDSEDPSKLHVTYPADKQQYLGLHRLVVRVILEGTEATYDAPAINLVASMEQAATPVVSEEVAIGIEITEVDTTIMHEILRACQQATDAANAAVAEAEQAIEDAEAATTAANSAAALANEKAAAAQSAATAATNAAALANEKAALANEAAAAAQQAKTAADEAAAAALEAKEAADESAENADANAALAQLAANSANTAATLAENRATEAHEAAAAATTAKNAANTAAAAALAAATEATSAADEASAKAILASDAAQTATQAATLANTKAGEAGNAAAAANTAASAATTAASSATSAASAATTAAESATTAAESANAAAELANEAAAAAQEAADTVEAFIANFEHAYLEGQRVGVADNIAPQGEGSEVEFTSRALTDVEENSVAMFPKIIGRTLTWNQLARFHSMEVAGISIVATTDRTIIINGTATEEIRIDFFDSRENQNWVNGHKYVIDSLSLPVYDRAAFGNITTPSIITNSNISPFVPALLVTAGQTFENTKCSALFTDITLLFGVGKEPTTYAEFLQRKPIVEDEYAFDEGTNVNNKVEKVVSTGIQLWDEEWLNGYYNNGVLVSGTQRICSKNPIPIMPSTNYYMKKPSAVFFMVFYDEGMNFISNVQANGAFTPPNNARYMHFFTYENGAISTYNHDICINLSDPSINGQYFPYEEHTLDLSWIAEIKRPGSSLPLFPYGLQSNNSIYDEVRADRAIRRIASDGEPLSEPDEVLFPAQNLCVKQTTGGVMRVEAGTGQNTTPFRAKLVNGLNAFGRLMAIGKTSELQTTAKTVVGAINELYAMITNAAAQSTE